MMMFEGDNALKKIAVLSGGEKSRVLLGKLIATPVNLLLLDEPTNHLDLESSDALLAALDNFPGAVIMVTHNEMFLHALAERLIVFQDDGIGLRGLLRAFPGPGGLAGRGDPTAGEGGGRKRHRRPSRSPRCRLRPTPQRASCKMRSEVITEKSRMLEASSKHGWPFSRSADRNRAEAELTPG